MVPIAGSFPCVANPLDFDCRDCTIGLHSHCRYRTDDALRHERAARFSGEADHNTSLAGEETAIAGAAKDILVRQRMAMPAAAIISLLPQSLAKCAEARQVESLLRTVPGIRETSPRMFKWQAQRPPLNRYRVSDDLSTGAAIAKMIAQFPPLPSETRRLCFKQLAAVRRVQEFDELNVARRVITSSIDHLGASVLEQEGWRLAETVAFACNGSQVPEAQDPEAESYLERRTLLVDILALDMLREFDGIEELHTKLRMSIVCHNLALSADQARRYATGNFLQFGDLFQAGVIGLYNAIDRYDPYLGFEFSTYAIHWIRQSITRTIANEERLIRIPVHAIETLDKIKTLKVDMCRRQGFDPSPEQVAKELRLGVVQVAELIQRSQPVTRLTGMLSDMLFSSGDEIDELEHRLVFNEKAESLLHRLDERQRFVIEHRFGFNDNEPKTLETIGRLLGVTGERIRQIEVRAIKRMRSKRPLRSRTTSRNQS